MFRIRDLEISGNKILSPMAGFSDSPTRRMARKFGSAISYTEFVAAHEILHKKPEAWRNFEFHESERPISFQIFGNDPKEILESAKLVMQKEPDILDINMGCSTAKVSGRGSGAGLLKNLSCAGNIFQLLRKEFPSQILTAKIRLGWDDFSLNYLDTIRVLEDSKVDAIAIHGRTKEMGYSGQARWEHIAEAKRQAGVPIFGNGDIDSNALANERLQNSKVNAVLIGRKAIGNPWIFQDGIDVNQISWSERLQVLLEHLELMVSFYGEAFGLRLFRKHFLKYLGGFDMCDDDKLFFMETTSLKSLVSRILHFSPMLKLHVAG